LKRLTLISFILLLAISACTIREQYEKPVSPIFKIGLIADCQYADQGSKRNRFYRDCPEKLRAAANDFNQSELAFVVHLGDYIDTDWQSFDVVDAAAATLNVPIEHVLGNHDFFVAEHLKHKIPARMGLSSRYYSREYNNWRFIYLDGNDISLYAWSKTSAQYSANLEIYKTDYQHLKDWNGGIGNEQLNWIKEQLEQAQQKDQQVIFFCHFPIYPVGTHNLWNAEQVLQLITQHDNVRAWINGHQHNGDYAHYQDIHFVTIAAMLDTPLNSYGELWFYSDHLYLKGSGRQSSFDLEL